MTPEDSPAIRLTWFKSSYSGAGATECVEAAAAPDRMFVRDSARPWSAQIMFGGGAWGAFLKSLLEKKLTA